MNKKEMQKGFLLLLISTPIGFAGLMHLQPDGIGDFVAILAILFGGQLFNEGMKILFGDNPFYPDEK